MPALSSRPYALAAVLAVAVLAAGCGGKTKTKTLTRTQTVVQTVTAPPAATSPTTPSGAATPQTAPTGPMGPRACGRIDISYPNGEGGSSAIGIVARGLGCAEARAVTRTCQRGNVTPGWKASVSGSGASVVMTSGAKRITFRLAGGGGCFG
jgi:hypothetical protein